MGDIDLSSFSNWDPIGDGDLNDTANGFSGILDGNGYSIKKLNVNTNKSGGLFGAISSSGEIKNLSVTNANVKGFGYSGIIAGVSEGTISNCNTSGDVTVVENKNSNLAQQHRGFTGAVGGITGLMSNGSISQSYSSANITCGKNEGVAGGGIAGFSGGSGVSYISNSYTTGNISGTAMAGGIIGGSYYAVLTSTYATGNISGIETAGGIAGHLTGVVSDSFSNANVESNDRAGGIAGIAVGGILNSYAQGRVSGTSTGGLYGEYGGGGWTFDVSNSFWDIQKTGQNKISNTYNPDSPGGYEKPDNCHGLSTSEMQNSQHFIDAGWDENIWDFSSAPPTLKNMPEPQKLVNNIRLQIGSDSSENSAIFIDTSFSLDDFFVDFFSQDSCAEAIDDIDSVLEQINSKRAEIGAAINRLNSILESQTTTIQNYTAAKSTIMDADILLNLLTL